MKLLDDKVCVITGGAGSIGVETAKLFLEHGARVMLADIDASTLERVARGLPASRVAIKVVNVCLGSEMDALFIEATDRWGGIDVIVSNAGTAGVIAAVAEYPEDAFDEVYRVHVNGAFFACKYGIPRMKDGGSLIITSSVAAFRGDPGAVAYVTAKHAQVGLMRTVAKEAASRQIRVNTLHPGPVDNSFQQHIEKNLTTLLQEDATEFFNHRIPLGRHASLREIAQAMLFLASDQSSFITGSTLRVDGGMS